MKIDALALKGLLLITPRVHRDQRGFFVERFNQDQFWDSELPTHFTQDSHSRSMPRVLRGLHFQRNPDQGKLVGVVRGQIWDVAVDIRPESPTFGKIVGTQLTADSGQMLWIPAGFAHGFCVLGDEPADVYYKVDAPYCPENEGGIRWNDPDLAIAWPVTDPILSSRDSTLGTFAALFTRMPSEEKVRKPDRPVTIPS